MKSETRFREAKEKYEQVRMAVLVKHPYIYSVLGKCTVKYVDIDAAGWDARVSGNTITVNRKFLEEDLKTALHTILHEVFHILLKHSYRFKQLEKKNRKIYNIAADCVVNQILQYMHYYDSKAIYFRDVAFRLGIPVEKLEKLSTEELYKLLLQHGGAGCEGSEDLDDEELEGEEETLQEGLPDAEFEEIAEEELESVERELKRAGSDAGKYLERIRKKSKDWRVELRGYITSFTTAYRKSWYKPSRRLKGLPGRKRYGCLIYWLIDTSASMNKDELGEIFGVVDSATRRVRGKHVVIHFDAKVQHVEEVRSLPEVIKAHGRGGTKLSPALQYVLEQNKRNSIVVVCSDFCLFDTAETERLLKKMRRDYFLIAVPTDRYFYSSLRDYFHYVVTECLK